MWKVHASSASRVEVELAPASSYCILSPQGKAPMTMRAMMMMTKMTRKMTKMRMRTVMMMMRRRRRRRRRKMSQGTVGRPLTV